MVGIVIVSHSAKVALGIKELAEQMTGGNSSIIAAGGLEDGSIGTDAVRIMEAIKKADTGDGVVVMVDLGSAVLSSNLAIELLGEGVRERIRIADAPVLEGAVIAAVQASIGDSLEDVLAAAEASRSMLKKV
ncbi:MAG TPA: dihydroxyacetone kinase phosphoryl donor subunit DhaM [Clostridia bacterium]|nr:dihydroxyacetone kinase phosphoryl donor subunit DhaM [Clostridia bacterium]